MRASVDVVAAEAKASLPTWAGNWSPVSRVRDTTQEIDGAVEEVMAYLHGAASDLVKEDLALRAGVDRAGIRL